MYLIREDKNINRTFVAIYKEQYYTLFYDYLTKEFFTVKERKQNILFPMLGAFLGIIFYSLFKNFTFNFGLISPLIIVIISVTLGCIIGSLASMWTWKVMKRTIKKNKKIISYTNNEVFSVVSKGRKELTKARFLISFLISFNLMTALFMLIVPYNALAFICNMLLWGVGVIVIWAVRPIKRKTVYKQLINEVTRNN